MIVVDESHRCLLQDPGHFNEDAVRAIYQNIVDTRICQQGFQWTKAQHFIQRILDQLIQILSRQRHPVQGDMLTHRTADKFRQ